MKIKEYNQMMEYLTRPGRTNNLVKPKSTLISAPTSTVSAPLTKAYVEKLKGLPQSLKKYEGVFRKPLQDANLENLIADANEEMNPKIMYNQGANKFEAMDPKDDAKVNQIYYNKTNTAKAIKKLADSPADVYEIEKRLELERPIAYNKNTGKFVHKKQKDEIKQVSALVFKEILVLMHPFIPFVTEEIWLKNKLNNNNKNYLMYCNWINAKSKKTKEIKNVNQIIDFITNLRSFKNEININPGSFIDISIENVKKNNLKFFKDNESIIKKIARINNFFNKDQSKPSVTIVINGDLIKLYFEESVDLILIKENLVKKQEKYNIEMENINKRLNNKNFVSRAPKHIVEQEKSNFNNLKNDINKISLIIQNL